jgi:hypothetical protein
VVAAAAGTGALRAVLWFDEVVGYLPPHPKDPVGVMRSVERP